MRTYAVDLPEELAEMLEQTAARECRTPENYIYSVLDLHLYGAVKFLPPLDDTSIELRRRPKRTHMSAATRVRIFHRDGGMCQICRGTIDAASMWTWHIDHITPVSRGGTNDEDNLQLTCAFCNLEKGAR